MTLYISKNIIELTFGVNCNQGSEQLQISYKNKKIERICTDTSYARKKHGIDMAKKIHQRINEIKASNDVENMLRYGIGRCHELKGDKSGEYAVDLVHPYRLIFSVKRNEIVIALIKEIIDYH